MRLLLVEDDSAIAAMIARGLEEERYVVDIAADGTQGLKLASFNAYALVLLDVMLPEQDGWQVCTELRRRRNDVPILMLTARGSVQDRVRGLTLGADDYLPKPFDFTELLARIHALLRRDKIHKGRFIRIADLEIDTRLRRVMRAGEEVPLTPREYTLLEALALREGQVLPREVIMQEIWLDEESYSNTVDVRIGLLRKKIDSSHPVKLIQTVHRVGYTLKDPVQENE